MNLSCFFNLSILGDEFVPWFPSEKSYGVVGQIKSGSRICDVKGLQVIHTTHDEMKSEEADFKLNTLQANRNQVSHTPNRLGKHY